MALDAKSETGITLGVLTAIEGNSGITQRSVAKELGIALGLANAYLKRCIRKGLVKVQQAPANRYAYYLTPHGFAEKSRLTAEYLSQGLLFFRVAREQLSEIFDICEQNRWQRVALYGTTDLTEIAIMSAVRRVEIVAIFDPNAKRATFAEIPVVQRFADMHDADAIVITDPIDGQVGYDQARAKFPTGRILVPALLNITLVPGAMLSDADG